MGIGEGALGHEVPLVFHEDPRGLEVVPGGPLASQGHEGLGLGGEAPAGEGPGQVENGRG